jgi:cysteine desulfurase/selenocysteine lyase
MDFYGIPATARASFAIYNSRKDVDAMINSVKKTIEVFA